MTTYEKLKSTGEALDKHAKRTERLVSEIDKLYMGNPDGFKIEYRLFSAENKQSVREILESEAKRALEESTRIKSKLDMVDSLLEGEK